MKLKHFLLSLIAAIMLFFVLIKPSLSNDYNINNFPENYLGKTYVNVINDFGKPNTTNLTGLNGLLVYDKPKEQILFMYRVRTNEVVGIGINFTSLANTKLVEFNKEDLYQASEYQGVINLLFKKLTYMQVIGLMPKQNHIMKNDNDLRKYVDDNFDLIGVKYVKLYQSEEIKVNN